MSDGDLIYRFIEFNGDEFYVRKSNIESIREMTPEDRSAHFNEYDFYNQSPVGKCLLKLYSDNSEILLKYSYDEIADIIGW